MANSLDYCREDLDQLMDHIHVLTPDDLAAWAGSWSDREKLYAIHAQLRKHRQQEQLLLKLLQEVAS